MSLLPCTSHANPTTPFWSVSGGGGGGGVTGVFSGSGISVDTNTGNVTVSNAGVTSIIAGSGISVDTNTGDVTVTNTAVTDTVIGENTSDANTSGVDNGDAVDLGIIKQPTFYPIEDNFYIAGITVNISDIVSAAPNYDGNIAIYLEYSDGAGAFNSGRQTLAIHHTSTNYYSASVVLGFKYVTTGQLKVSFVNQSGDKINSFNYDITNFYCTNMGAIGSTNNPIF